MATFLYRLGRGAFRRRWLVALLWLVVLVGTAVGAVMAPSAPDPATTMPGIESQRAFDLINERFPDRASDGATARIVFVARDGGKVTDADTRAAIDRTVAEVSDGGQVAAAADPFASNAVSADGTTAYATVSYTVPAAEVSDPSKDALQAAVDGARETGVTVEVGGDVLESEVSAGGAAEGIGLLIAAVVLLITFGSMAAAGLPLLTAVIGVGATLLGIAGLASALDLPSTTTALASMLGLAVGIDYALFIVSRYREERAKGQPAREAAGLAVGTAGTAVVFAGLTVVIALAGLFVIGIPILTSMGLAAAAAVLVAVLIALTLGAAGK